MNGHLLRGEDAEAGAGRARLSGFGAATVLVREGDNSGLVTGSVRAEGHTYTVLMQRFRGERPFMSGGIAARVTVDAPPGSAHRRAEAYLAGWGPDCRVWKDSEMLYDKGRCRFLLIDGPDGRTELHVLARGPRGADTPELAGTLHLMWDDVQWWDAPEDVRPPGGERRGWTDAEIATFVERGLAGSTLVDAADIDVRVDDGHVFLSGTARSARERDQASMLSWVQGVKSVRNEIAVRRAGSPQAARAVPDARQDRNIRRAIERTLEADSFVDADRIRVDVRQGRVTLRGAVASAAEKRHASIMAWTPGVTSVRNELRVQPDQPEDREAGS